MTHTHTAKTTKNIFGNTLSECSCGARKWDNDKAILGATIGADGWYVAKVVEAEDNTYEMLQTEGYGYGNDASDLLDSHTPNID